ncbi:NACHT domain-containing protein [Rubripirellula amarantea]|nr:NACHT domain-containing protein [Rubripirellula amarantea]
MLSECYLQFVLQQLLKLHHESGQHELHQEAAPRSDFREESPDQDPNGSIAASRLLNRIAALARSLGILPTAYTESLPTIITDWERSGIWNADPSPSLIRDFTRSTLRRNSHTKSLTHAGASRTDAMPHMAYGSWCLDVSAQLDSVAGQPMIADVLLRQWLDQLQSHRRWTHLASSVPGHCGEPIDKVFIHREAAINMPSVQAANRSSIGFPLIDLLSDTLHELLVIGEAKSGKSTLVQWLAFQGASGNLEHYDYPIVVDLVAFAAAIRERPSISLMEYFCISLNCPSQQLREASVGIRSLCQSNENFLLLLDNWNEVPLDQRDLVRERIAFESEHVTTLITTQASGMPQAFAQQKKTTLCWLKELSSDVAFNVATSTLMNRYGATEETATETAVEIHSHYREFTQSPFWLHQTTSAFANCKTSDLAFHQTRLIEQLVRWSRQNLHNADSSNSQLSLNHLDAFASLANRMVFNPQCPRCTFFSEELERIAQDSGCHHWPLLQSRLVRVANSTIDSYAFAFTAIRDYFAAYHWLNMNNHETANITHATANNQKVEDQFDAAMQSKERFPFLIHAVRLERCSSLHWHEHAKRWLHRTDQSKTLLLRLAKLFLASQNSNRADDPLLMSLIHKVQRSLDRPCSPETKRQLRMALDRLRNPTANQTWRSSRPGVQVIRLTREDRSNSYQPKSIEPLTGQLIDRQLAADILAQCDRTKELNDSLARLREHQVHDFSHVLIDIACDAKTSEATKRLCLKRLMEAGNLSIITSRASDFASFDRTATIEQALNLIVRWDIGSAFTDLIVSTLQRSPRLQSTTPVLAAISAIQDASTNQHPILRSLLGQEICRVLQNPSQVEVESLNRHLLSLDQRQRRNVICDAVQSNVVAMWNDLTHPERISSAAHLSLASLLMQTFPFDVARVHFAQAVRRNLQLFNGEQKGVKESSPETVSKIVDILVEHMIDIDCETLIEIIHDHPSMKEKFCHVLFDRQWIWIGDRVLDDSGRLVATKKDRSETSPCLSTPDAVQEIAVALPRRQRSDFLSYWYMVSEGNEGYQSNDREKIYQDLCLLVDSSLPTELGEKLASCYDDGRPPAFATWRKNLSRVVQRCDSNPQWSAYLHEIGLGVHRRSPK